MIKTGKLFSAQPNTDETKLSPLGLEVVVKKRLKGFALDVDFHMAEEGGTVALFGPSGTGKSLTLQVIAGLVEPDSGRVSVRGQTLYDSARRIYVPARLRRVGYVPQNYTL